MSFGLLNVFNPRVHYFQLAIRFVCHCFPSRERLSRRRRAQSKSKLTSSSCALFTPRRKPATSLLQPTLLLVRNRRRTSSKRFESCSYAKWSAGSGRSTRCSSGKSSGFVVNVQLHFSANRTELSAQHVLHSVQLVLRTRLVNHRDHIVEVSANSASSFTPHC